MIRKSILIIGLLSISFISFIFAQNEPRNFRRCGSMEVLERLKKEDPSLDLRMKQIERNIQKMVTSDEFAREGQAVKIIPTVVHIVYNTSTQNISDAQIQSQINILNADFRRLNADRVNTPSGFTSIAADAQIEFCLATIDPNGAATTGITRTSTSTTSFVDDDRVKSSSTGGKSPWDATKYLNIWVCNLGSGLLGYAQFPGGPTSTDGVVIGYKYFGNTGTATAPFNKGRTTTHEVGHYFNLYHIWGDASCGNDGVSDTPTQQVENYGCPTYPHKTCGNTTYGDMFMNYMDYTDDACMNAFSTGQASRMASAISTSRPGLLTSGKCGTSTPATCNVPASLTSSSITSSSATVSWGSTGAVSYNIQYKTSAATTWTTTTSTTNSKSLSGLTASTTYNYKVMSVCAGSSSAYSAASSFTTSAATSSCGTDSYESNDAMGSAKNISNSTNTNGLICPSTDVDWFSFSNGSTYNVVINLSNLPADYDLQLYNSSGTLLQTSENGGTTAEAITYSSAPVGTYYIKVFGYNGATSATVQYILTATYGTATATCNVPASLTSSSITSNSATVSWGSTGAVSYNIQYKTSAATTWTTTTSTTNSKSLTGLTASTTYNYKVMSVCASSSSAYSTAASFTTSAASTGGCGTDSYESNNTMSYAKSISTSTSIYGLICPSTDVDWFKFSNTSTYKNIKVTLSNLPADYDLYLYNSSGTLVKKSENGGTTAEKVIYNAAPVGTYYIKVLGYNGATHSSTKYKVIAYRSSTAYTSRESGEEIPVELSNEAMNEVNVYPNPAKNQLTLQFFNDKETEITVSVKDMIGREVISNKQVSTVGENLMDFNLSTLTSGIYILNIGNGNETKTKKFVILK